MKFLLASLLVAMPAATHAAEVLHLQGRALMQTEEASLPLARGLQLPGETHLVLESGSQTLIRISDQTSLEIRGPARATLSSGLFWNLESGHFLLSTRGLSPHRFRILDVMLRPEDAAIEIEIPLSRSWAQILLMWGAEEIDGQDLELSRLYVLEGGRLQFGEIPSAQVLKRRQAYPFSEPFFRRIEDAENVISLRNQLAFSQVSALNSFTQDSSTEAASTSVSFGVRAEWIHKRYLDFPKRPQRIHFLRSPALRFGGGATYSSNGANVAQEARQNFSGHALLGASWRGLALDTLLTYFRPSGAGVSSPTPFQYGVRALYEWDLKDFTANDMMFGLGYGYTVSKITSSASYTVASQSLNLSLIFNF